MNQTHNQAINALCGCAATVTVLSYQEAIEGYFTLRGITLAQVDALGSDAPPAVERALHPALPLIEAIAKWERENGTLAAIMPSEYGDFCRLIADAAVHGSARAAALHPSDREEGLREAAQAVVDNASRSYRSRGKDRYIEDESGELVMPQTRIEGGQEPQGAGEAAGQSMGQARPTAAEVQAVVARLDADCEGIVAAWDRRYAPEGIGAGIMAPVEVQTMRDAAAMLRALSPTRTPADLGKE